MNDQSPDSTADTPNIDALWAFSFTEAPVRGAIVRLDGVWARIRRDHQRPVAQLLGEMLAGTALLAHLLKDTDVALQTRGDGLISTLMTECIGRNALRGVAQLRDESSTQAGDHPAAAEPGGAGTPAWSATLAHEVADIGTLLGHGHLAITLRPPFGEPHQGIVPLEGASVAGCIEHYFATSEQLPTHVWLSARDGVAAGLLLQRIPLAPESNEMSDARAAALWEEIGMLASTLTSEELRGADVATLLTHLFHAHPMRLLPTQAMEARCTCSRERSLGVLRLLGRAEVESVLAERGEVDMHCQFCGSGYLFLAADLASLWTD